MYVKLVWNTVEAPISREVLYECSGLTWDNVSDPVILNLQPQVSHQGFDIEMVGEAGETLTVYTMNSNGKTIDSRSFEF